MTTAQLQQETPADPRQEWLEARRKGIGGSDVAALFGLDPYGRTPTDIYDDKLGVGEDRAPTPAMLRGQYLEPIAASLYAEKTGRSLRSQPIRAHREFPWMLGTCDRQILARVGGVSATGILEVKCPGIRQFSKVKSYGLSEGYLLQLSHYLTVFGYSWGSFALFNAEAWELIHFDIEADPAISERLIEVEHDFWHKHVLAGVRPEAAVAEPPKLPEVSGTVITRADPEWADAVQMLQEAKELTASAKDLESAAKDRLKELAGGYGVFEGEGARVYFRELAGRKTFDKRALAAAKPLNRVLVREALQNHGTPQTVIEVVMDSADLDLELFEKQGKGYEELRTYFLSGGDDA